MALVYRYRNMQNGKSYVGSTVNSLSRRWAVHFSRLRRGVHHNAHLQHAFSHYGEAAFVLEVLEDGLPSDQRAVEQREGYWIEHLKTWDPEFGYNGCRGEGARVPGTEARQKMSEAKLAASKARSLPVVQYDLNGHELASFSSVFEAARASGADYGDVYRVCSGQRNRMTAGGFRWSFLGEQLIFRVPKTRARAVRQLTLDGQVVAEHPSITAAAAAVGCLKEAVGDVARKRSGRETAVGFRWDFVTPGARSYRITDSESRSKAVEQVDPGSGAAVATFRRVVDAAAAVGVRPNTVSAALKSGGTAGGYKWRFV
jgi:hypothetical protein